MSILTNKRYRNGEICGGIVCGCMTSLPQLFRHFIPKISTALGLSGRGKSATSCAASEQSDPAQDPRVAFGRSPYGDKDSYVELGERSHPSKTSGPAGRAYEVWTDEVSVCDEEKGLAPVVVDRITHSRGS